jgi:hypothetical protein
MEMQIKKLIVAGAAVLLVLSLSACAAGPNGMVNEPGLEGTVAGFWLGMWHGFISFFTFIISLFNNSVHVYEVHNNGGWYNFGFILGIMMFYGGGGNGSSRARRR